MSLPKSVTALGEFAFAQLGLEYLSHKAGSKLKVIGLYVSN